MELSHNFVLLIDHENVPFGGVSLQEIVASWLDSIRAELPSSGILTINVRAYGGWFEEEIVSPSRYSANEFYVAQCPSTFKFEGYYCRLLFAFADNLAARDSSSGEIVSARITHTVAMRESPKGYRILSPTLTCSEASCELNAIRRWLRRGKACFKKGCPHDFSDFFRRVEQKQVDVHIATDLIYYSVLSPPRFHVALASDDLDLLPAVACASIKRNGLSTLSVVRFLKASTYLDEFLTQNGTRIVSFSKTLGGGMS